MNIAHTDDLASLNEKLEKTKNELELDKVRISELEKKTGTA